MLKKIKISIISVFTLSLFAVPALAIAPVYAQDSNSSPDINGSLCEGANLQFGSSEDCQNESTEDDLNQLIANIVNIISVIVGIVAVIMIIYGGFKYITSGGDSGNVSGAKNTILYAIIGLIIVALAQFIVRFVLNQSSELVG